MLLEAASLLKVSGRDGAGQKILSALAGATRETDIRGWYKQGSVIGIIFTEIGALDRNSTWNILQSKIEGLLSLVLTAEQVSQINLLFYVFPEDRDASGIRAANDSMLYTDLVRGRTPKKVSLLAKRSIDIVGGALALVVASPLLVAIAVVIKLTSKGPVLFRQKRVGQYGDMFTFVKFRSMYSENNHTIHKEYVKRLIAGAIDSEQPGQAVYKLTNDPRVTPVGRFLRKTSLDELPQFLNVLTGDMSLVGPRPPVLYEVECYDIWHKRRLQEVKPGITGLWQVTGRSRTKFDEMVRLDLQYAKSWSLWLDLKILWRTPNAVLTGHGAY